MSQAAGTLGNPADVGNEFAGGFEDAMAAEAAQEEAPAAAEPSQSEGDEDAVASSWADPDPKDADREAAPSGAKASPPGAAPAVIELKTAKGIRKFELTPENAELLKELNLAQGARKWQAERDEARKAATTSAQEAAKAAERAGIWDELQSLSQAGQTERVVRAVLGDNYEAFRKSLVDEHMGYESGSPEQRAAIAQARADRDREFERHQFTKELTAKEAKLKEIEDRTESTRLKTLGTSALQAVDFRKSVDDPDVANALNAKTWKLAWADLEEMAEAGAEITPDVVQRAFVQNAKVLGAGRSKQVTKQVTKVLETKRQDATRKAQVAATERYPTTKPDLSGWNGRNAKDLLKILVKGK